MSLNWSDNCFTNSIPMQCQWTFLYWWMMVRRLHCGSDRKETQCWCCLLPVVSGGPWQDSGLGASHSWGARHRGAASQTAGWSSAATVEMQCGDWSTPCGSAQPHPSRKVRKATPSACVISSHFSLFTCQVCWFNTGWLGVKHQASYSLLLQKEVCPKHLWVFCVVLLKSAFFLNFCVFGSCFIRVEWIIPWFKETCIKNTQ